MDIYDLGTRLKNLFSAADRTGDFAENEIKGRRFMAMLAALPLLFWLPLARHEKSRFVLFHANNGLLLFLACCAAALLSLLLRLTPAGWLILLPMWGFLAVESVFSSIDALCGNARELHLLSKLGLRMIK